MDKMKNNALNKLTDAGGIVFLVLFPHLVPLPLYSYSIVCLLMIWFLLRKKGRTFRDIGLGDCISWLYPIHIRKNVFQKFKYSPQYYCNQPIIWPLPLATGYLWDSSSDIRRIFLGISI